MNHLRWNPLLKTYTLIATNRTLRPHFPDECPFCPGNGKIEHSYDVLALPNEFPVLSKDFDKDFANSESFFKSKSSTGACEVILYSSDHFATLYDLDVQHIEKIIHLWKERTKKLSESEYIQYIHVFENRGQEVGSSIHHPHGQIYGYPFIPLKIQTELTACREHFNATGKNLILEINAEEEKDGSRMITSNKSFLSYIPYFSDYPLGVFIAAKRQKSSFLDFSNEEITDLASILKEITGALDAVYKKPLPYTMSIHQAPLNSNEFQSCNQYYSFHIEFYPVLKDASNVKFHGGSEMGAWATINSKLVEESAEELRAALKFFKTANKK